MRSLGYRWLVRPGAAGLVLAVLGAVAIGAASNVVNPFAGSWSTFGGHGTLNLQVVTATKGEQAVAYYSGGAATCVAGTVYYTGSYTASGDSGQIAGCTDATGRKLESWYKSSNGPRNGTIDIDAGAGDTTFAGTYHEASDGTSGVYDGVFKADFDGSGRTAKLSTATIVADLRLLEGPDMHDVKSLYDQIPADAQKHILERWTVRQQTNTKLVEIQEDITVTRARTQDKAYQKWDEYIRQAADTRAHDAAGQSPLVGEGRALCKSGRCRIVVTPTAYGRTLVTQDRGFVILISIRSNVPGYRPVLTVQRAWNVPAKHP